VSRPVPDRATAVWAIPSGDGSCVVEVCREGEKYVVVVAPKNGARYRRSSQPIKFERAKADATWLANDAAVRS
jgi:hypothetical protein